MWEPFGILELKFLNLLIINLKVVLLFYFLVMLRHIIFVDATSFVERVLRRYEIGKLPLCSNN